MHMKQYINNPNNWLQGIASAALLQPLNHALYLRMNMFINMDAKYDQRCIWVSNNYLKIFYSSVIICFISYCILLLRGTEFSVCVFGFLFSSFTFFIGYGMGTLLLHFIPKEPKGSFSSKGLFSFKSQCHCIFHFFGGISLFHSVYIPLAIIFSNKPENYSIVGFPLGLGLAVVAAKFHCKYYLPNPINETVKI